MPRWWCPSTSSACRSSRSSALFSTPSRSIRWCWSAPRSFSSAPITALPGKRPADDAWSPVSALAQQADENVFRHRLAEEVALHFVATQQAQDLGLLLRLHALGDHLQAQRVGKRDDRRDKSHGVGIVVHLDDEGSIDLQRLHRQLRQIAERGITGTEVVDR